MEIRILTADDATEYSRLRLEALEGDAEAFSSSPEDHKALGIDEIKRRLGEGNSDFLVAGAFENKRLIGIAGFFREKGAKVRHKGRIWGVYVTPAHRGIGVGRKIVQLALDRGWAIEGIEQVLLSVATTQAAATSLYLSLGFERFGCEPRALKVNGRWIDEEYFILRTERNSSPQNQRI